MQHAKQTLVMLIENHTGALSNLIGLFAQRAVNIDSLQVETLDSDETLSTVTLTSKTPTEEIKSLAKQIDRLVDVIQVELVSQ